MSAAQHCFLLNTTHRVIICRVCQFAVRPTQVVRHLTNTPHRLTGADALQVQQEIYNDQQWESIEYNNDREFPTTLHTPVDGLQGPFADGIRCQRSSGCRYVCRRSKYEKTLKRHWREEHGWSPCAQAGHPTTQEVLAIQDEISRFSKPVVCQRFFKSQKGSHYIEIRQPGPEFEPAPSVPSDTQLRGFREFAEANHAQLEREDREVVEAGEVNEGNSWLRRTRWPAILQGIPEANLLRCTRKPMEGHEGEEAAMRVIWDATMETIRISQQTTTHAGENLQFEAARTEKNAMPRRPLQPYMKADNIQRHGEPVQKLMMFFARTQCPHDWVSPVYRLNRRQTIEWNRLWGAASAELRARRARSNDMDVDAPAVPTLILTPLQSAILDFWVSLLSQKVQRDYYGCAVVQGLAVLGMGKRGWMDAESYPPILSKIIKVSRFMVLYKAISLDPSGSQILTDFAEGNTGPGEELGDYLDDLGDDIYLPDADPASPRPTTPSPPSSPPLPTSDSQLVHLTQLGRRGRPSGEWLQIFMDRFMVHGTKSPMVWMLTLRQYGLKIHYNTTVPGHVFWEGEDRIQYKDIQFTMRDFRSFVHGLEGRTRETLFQDLLLCDRATVPVIPWAAMRDDPTEPKVGWSFLDDRRTPWPVDGSRWILHRISEVVKLRRFIDPYTQRPRLPAIKRYIDQVVRFRERLSVLVHITGGQPARAPELLSLRHRNTKTGMRNMFIEDGMVVMASTYHKGFYASNDAKIIQRYLPRGVSELVVWYLWLVLLFVELLEEVQHTLHPGPQSWREIRIQNTYIWSPDPITGREWMSERFRDQLKSESDIRLGGYWLNIPIYRNIAIAITRRYLEEKYQFPQNKQDGVSGKPSEDEEEDEDDTFAKQAAHSPHTAGLIYGRLLTEQAGTSASTRQLFCDASQQWHQLLGFRKETHARTPTAGVFSSIQERLHRERFEALREIDMAAQLRRMTGNPTILFRGIQQPAIQAIQEGRSPIVAVMPTGGGKSILFMLPVYCSPHTVTIVVVPLIALRGDLRRRCNELGIECREWDQQRPPESANLVLVTPEASTTDAFKDFVIRQRELQQLDRIVIDECHTLLGGHKDFRPMIGETAKVLGGIARVQMVYLTATLPPRKEAQMCLRMNVPPEHVHWYRSRTHRPNVAYRVWSVPIECGYEIPDQWMQMDSVIQFIRGRQQRFPTDKVVVYGYEKGHVRMMADQLQCEAYFSDQPDRSGILDRFRRGEHRVIVATSALGMGVDIPDIRSIIHLGRPRSLLDYAQESGRAGRDGQPSEAIVILPDVDEVPRWAQAMSSAEQALVEQYLDNGCRRVTLDDYLDGHSRSHCEPDEAQCDRCDPDWMIYNEIPESEPEAISDSEISEYIDSPVSVLPPATLHIPEITMTDMPAVDRESGALWLSSEISQPAPQPVAPDESPARRSTASIQSQAPRISPVRQWTRQVTPAVPAIRAAETIPHRSPKRLRPTYEEIQRSYQAEWDRTRSQRGTEMLDHQILIEDLDRWQGRCWICAQEGQDDEHELINCQSPNSKLAKHWQYDMRRIQYQGFIVCYSCHMPQSLCPKWRSNHTAQCKYNQFLLINMVAMMINWTKGPKDIIPGFRARLAAAGIPDERKCIAAWFGTRAEGVSTSHSQLIATFIWLRKEFRQREEVK